MKIRNQNIDRIILSYLQGRASVYEMEVLRKWIMENEEHRAIFDSTKLYWENSRLDVKSNDIDRAYDRFKVLSEENVAKNAIHLEGIKESFNWRKFAAVFIVICTISATIFLVNISKVSETEKISIQRIVKENPQGQKLTTFLSDGSKVILNAQSKLSFNYPFGGNERLLELEGEAFFEVKKDSLRPFKVISKGITTTALGTSFNVNSKNGDQVEVVLVSGKVKVADDEHQAVILNPGKAVKYSLDGEYLVSDFDYLEKVGWKEGILVFKEDSIPGIISKLENWYGVAIQTDGIVEGTNHYSGIYNNRTLEEVLNGISYVHDFKFIMGDTIRLYKIN